MKETIKILVTGANGQLGSELKKLSTKYPNFSFLFTDVSELDITNPQACIDFFKTNQPKYLINCAAYTAVDKAETDIDLSYKINVQAVKNLIKACELNSTTFIHISTDYVFNGKNYRPYIETDITDPQSVYGQTKEQGEKELLHYTKSIIIRTSWLYSTFGNNFVKTILKLASERNELNVIFDQIGTPTYAEDLANAILTIINNITKGKAKLISGTYHYSNEGACSWYDFACSIIQKKELKCKVMPIESKDYPTPAKRPYYSILNKTKIKTTFGIEIPHWEKSLQNCIDELT